MQDDSGLSYLGPYDDIWDSACLKEFGYDIIHRINQAEQGGLLSINKFWAFEHYNYMVFSSSVEAEGVKAGKKRQVESNYLSPAAYALEIFLAALMATVSLVTVVGNSAVFVAILVDPVNKKSVYQYFQMSLCLADVLMGVAGAGAIVYTQVGHVKLEVH